MGLLSYAILKILHALILKENCSYGTFIGILFSAFLSILISETCIVSCTVLILAVKVMKYVHFCSLACSATKTF